MTGDGCRLTKSLSITDLTKSGVVEPSNTAVCIQSSKLLLFIYFTFHRSSGIKPLRYRNSHIQTRYIKYVVNTLRSMSRELYSCTSFSRAAL